MSAENFSRPVFKDAELLRKGAYIDGQWVETAPEYFEVTNPANSEVIATLPEQPVSEVERAIDVAFDSFKTFKNTAPRERARWLRNMYNLMIENIDDLAKLIAWENGKAMSDAIGEVRYAASYYEWYAEEAPRMYGTTIQPGNPTNRVITMRQPVGVCGIICPWNFPSAMITRKAAAALAAGCTVVIKPDSSTPLSALALAYLMEKAGFPKGVFNVVLSHTRTPEFGLRLCESPKVKKITFTGSTAVGKILMKQSASTLKKLSLELGGNAPLIVFADADMDQAVEQAIASKFRGLGQTCVCCNRLYVHSSIIDEFAERIAAEVRKFVVGNGLDPKNTHGCLINGKAVAKVEHHKQDAVSRGAKVVVEGGLLPELGPNFYAPVVLSHVPYDAVVAKEETFGPLCPIFSFDTIEEVVGYANDSEFGLASYVFSKNIDTVYTVAEALESGMVSANTGLFSDCSIPFGGVKESGFGREGSLYGIEDYTVIKTLNIGSLPPRI